MDNQTTALMQFNELTAIAADAPAIYKNNMRYLSLMREKGQALLDTIEAGGMSPELDIECNQFLINCKTVKEKANTARAPMTRLFDAFASEFTGIENQMEVKKADTIPFKVQAYRNELARVEALEQQRKQQELRNKQLADQERIDLKIEVQLRVREKYNEILFNYKKKYNEVFNTMNLENIEDVRGQINSMLTFYPEDKFALISCTVTAIYLKPDQLEMLVTNARAALYFECRDDFKTNMEALQQYLLEQIPARKNELEEIELNQKANKKLAEQMRQDAALRQQEETLRLAKENQQREQMAEASANTQKLVGHAELEFDKEVQQAEIFGSNTQVVKHSYVIQVMSATGWMQVINLWFKHFGNKTDPAKIATKKPESMKKDLEVLAFNGGERLENSGHLFYEADVKAVTKATK